MAAMLTEPLLRIGSIPADQWTRVDNLLDEEHIDLTSGIIQYRDCHPAQILVNESQLRKFNAFQTRKFDESQLRKVIERPRRGPIPGKLRRYADSDQALFPEMDRIIREQRVSPTEAARQLVEEIRGSGCEESKVRRLAKAYSKSRG
jgi:hypothetical protein